MLLQCYINFPGLRKWRQEVQKVKVILGYLAKFEASLGYMRSSLRRRRKRRKEDPDPKINKKYFFLKFKIPDRSPLLWSPLPISTYLVRLEPLLSPAHAGNSSLPSFPKSHLH